MPARGRQQKRKNWVAGEKPNKKRDVKDTPSPRVSPPPQRIAATLAALLSPPPLSPVETSPPPPLRIEAPPEESTPPLLATPPQSPSPPSPPPSNALVFVRQATLVEEEEEEEDSRSVKEEVSPSRRPPDLLKAACGAKERVIENLLDVYVVFKKNKEEIAESVGPRQYEAARQAMLIAVQLLKDGYNEEVFPYEPTREVRSFLVEEAVQEKETKKRMST